MYSFQLPVLVSLALASLCDLQFTNGVCLFGGQSVLMPDAAPEGLIAHWSFDDSRGLDSSGHQHHAKTAVGSGPAQDSRGASAYFSGNNYAEVDNTAELNATVFTYTMWVYLYRDAEVEGGVSTGFRWCPLLQKGLDDPTTRSFARAPALFLDRRERGLRFYITSTASDTYPQGEYIESAAHLPYQRWTHLALLRGERRSRLYVNGILDVSNSTDGSTVANSGSLYLGGTPSSGAGCQVAHLLDEVRVYSRELSEEDIEAEAAGALGGIEPRYVRLGCTNCGQSTAEESCPGNYHLCTGIELHSGAYQVARANGWVGWSSRVWARGAQAEDGLGLGLCCQDLR